MNGRLLLRRPWLWIALGLLVAGAAWWLTRMVASSRDVTWARIREAGVWRVGMDPSFPPFEALDPATQQPVGLDVDLANAIAARWGVRAEIVGVGFDQLLDAVQAKRIDSAISALPVFEHRTRDVSFSQPYCEAGLLLVVPARSPIRGPDDLAGRRVVAEWGSEGDAQARALSRRLEGTLVLVLKDSPDAALDALAAGEADAALVDAISLALHDAGQGRLVPAGPPLRSNPYVVVVPVDAPRLLQALDDALAALEADGTLAQIRGRWLRR